jgi:hypothetical protein
LGYLKDTVRKLSNMLIHISKEVTLLCVDVLTTYLTRTGGRGDGDNGENGEKKGQKRSKKAQNGLKKDIKAIVFRLGC